MFVSLKKIRHNCRFSLLVMLLLAVIVEWIEYALMPVTVWPKLSKNTSQESVKILIVADPQLLGIHYTIKGILGTVCWWDADRYVRRTFVHAYHFVNPDLVLFLGDILDEGEIASDEEFIIYFERFKKIFQEVDFNKAVIIPGDNDIGGEDKPPQPFFEKRFNKYFKDDVFIRYRFLELVKVNYITRSNNYQVAPKVSDSVFRIILSHIPLTSLFSTFVSRVIPYVKPHIILSAHDHKSQHIMANRKTGSILQTPSMFDFQSTQFNVSDSILHEILVPTCSYRMGTHKMGYGVLQISKNGEVSYDVLWLPSRFRQLLILLFLLVLVLIYVLVFAVKFCVRQKHYLGLLQQYSQRRLFHYSGI